MTEPPSTHQENKNGCVVHIYITSIITLSESILMREKNIQNESINSFIKLIENCEYARYTPSTNVAISNDYENAVKVISEIDKQI